MDIFKKMTQEQKITAMIAHTNERINAWYESTLEFHGLEGKGFATYNEAENKVTVEYTEEGEDKVWSMAFYPEYISNGFNYVYNCWMEQA